MPIYIRGLRETSAAYSKLERETNAGLRGGLRDIAEPVQRTAEALSQARIVRIGRKWWKMRVGVTRTVVYVAPGNRGVRRHDDPRRREKFAGLLMEKAMEPALKQNEAKVERAVDRLLDHVIDDFNH